MLCPLQSTAPSPSTEEPKEEQQEEKEITDIEKQDRGLKNVTANSGETASETPEMDETSA